MLTERVEQLPIHDQRSTNASWRDFGCEDGDHRRFAAHADTKDDPTGKKLLPCLHQRAPDRGGKNEDRRDNDCSSASEQKLVGRVGQEEGENGGREPRRCIYNRKQPRLVALRLTRRACRVEQIDRPCEVCTIAASLIP